MISVIVRSHNDIGVIRRTMDALTAQRGVAFEILNFDDASTDGTAEVIAGYPGVRQFAPEGAPYNPARVLNRAVGEARGEVVVFNNSDAVPLSDDYLLRLTAPLQDPAVGAVFGNQLCRADASFLVRKDHLRSFGDGREAATWRHFFSLVSSAARRELLLAEPFDRAFQYSEDIEWSWRLRRKRGLRVVYVPEARVEHSHNYTLPELRVRFFQEGVADARIFGGKLRFAAMVRQTLMELLRDFRFEVRHRAWREILPGMVYRLTQKIAFFRGMLAYERGARK